MQQLVAYSAMQPPTWADRSGAGTGAGLPGGRSISEMAVPPQEALLLAAKEVGLAGGWGRNMIAFPGDAQFQQAQAQLQALVHELLPPLFRP